MTGVIATTEATLCRIFADVLGLELVRPDEEFFEAGGDSVLALQVVARAREAGLALSVRDLFDHQTPRALAAVTGDLADLAAAPLTAGGSEGSLPRADTEPPLLTLTADELDKLADTDIDQQVSGTEAGWETFT